MKGQEHRASEAGWRKVLAATRAFNRQAAARFDMRPYWRALACRREPAGTPEPIVRAHAFAEVLDRVPLHRYPGESIVGNRAGFRCDTLPTDIAEPAYQAAVRECQERGQRDFTAGWDHTLADYPALLATGIAGRLADIARSRAAHAVESARITLDAMRLTLEAFAHFVARHAEIAPDPELADGLAHIARHPPRTFREAIQLVWLTQIAFISEGRYANALGRLDQYLYPFYCHDLDAGRLTPAQALNLLCHLWAHIEELGEVTNICIGGLTPDGADATNELSHLCLEATQLVQSPHANLSARFHDATPEAFHRACFRCIRTGVGFPAIFNDHVLLEGLLEIGIPLPVARDACMVGCIETMLPGRQQAWSDSRFNTPLHLLDALRRWAAKSSPAWDDLLALFREELAAAVAAHAERINAHIRRFPPARFPDPFLSALTRDCIARARDINDGGAEFARFHGIAVMGLATVTDSLAAVRTLVLDEHRLDLGALMASLARDFEGDEALRQMLVNRAPKYGNGDSRVDDIAAWVVAVAADECLKHEVAGGGRFVAAMAANISNIAAGREVGATPDGRRAGTPLSDAASPFFGRDRGGPTAFLESVARPDYHRVLTGTVINMKFEPELLAGPEGEQTFLALTRYFVRRRIPQLQFNFTGNALLHEAQEHPEAHGNLVVRVSGFSAYFTRLGREVQEDIIRRRAHPG